MGTTIEHDPPTGRGEQKLGVLSGAAIRSLSLGADALVSEYIDLDAQIQPNGVDLTLAEVRAFKGQGCIAVSNNDRILPDLEPVIPDGDGFFDLQQGSYHVTYNEVVSLPAGLMAFGRPRSSLNRSGVTIHTAVWDAGYTGRSTSLLQVVNPAGFRLQVGARVMQLVFVRLESAAEQGYSGAYQGENLQR